jgi:flagellar biosynthesis/type III secretory pathway chaperone
MFEIEPLVKVLQEILATNLEVHNLENRKKETLIKGDMEELSSIVNEETRLIRLLGKLEEDRSLVVKQLAKEANLPSSDPTLRELLSHVKDPVDRNRLEELQLQLVSLMKEIQQVNELNQQLIQQSLDYINYTIDLITDAPDEQVYQKPLQRESVTYHQPKRSLFDTKA